MLDGQSAFWVHLAILQNLAELHAAVLNVVENEPAARVIPVAKIVPLGNLQNFQQSWRMHKTMHLKRLDTASARRSRFRTVPLEYRWQSDMRYLQL